MARKGYKLASYKLPEDLIESLKAEAEKRGTSQTALLVAGLRYVLGMESGTALSTVESVPDTAQRIDLNAVATVPDIDQRIDSAIAPILAEVEELKGRVDLLMAQPAPIRPTGQKLPSENARVLRDEVSVQSIVKQQQPSTGKVKVQNYGILPPSSARGLSQTEICNFYGLSWRNLTRNATIAGFDNLEGYLHKVTGIAWTYGKTAGRTKLYFPVAE